MLERKAIMRKLNMCGTIIAALVSGLIISGYKCTDINDARCDKNNYVDIQQSNYKNDDDRHYNSNQNNINQNKKDFLIITWEDDNNVIDKLASLTNADIYKPQLSDNYVRVYEDIDMSDYSTYIVNLSSGSENSINILEQMADEYYLDGKTIIPLYDSKAYVSETINELEDRTECSVWLTGRTLEKNADNEEVADWIKSLGIFIDL